MPRNVPQETSTAETTTSVNPPDTTSRLDIGGVPLDVFNMFNVPLTATAKEVAKLKTISDWAKYAGTPGDALLKIRQLEEHLGAPSSLDKRYQKVWQYCQMDMYSRELDKKKQALRRRF